MSWRRVLLFSAAIAFLPGFTWWLVVVLTNDPDEGANIGAGLMGLGVIGVSWVLATLFLLGTVVRRQKTRARRP